MRPTAVYKFTNRVNGKVYFGKTSDIQVRWKNHQWQAAHGSLDFFHRAIRKYGSESFYVEILAIYPDNTTACEHERRLIATTPKKQTYNLAEGGDGGHTMSEAQLEAQYTIKPDRYDEFRGSFLKGATQKELMNTFQASANAVRSCVKRLGLSFKDRRFARKQESLRLLVEQRLERSNQLRERGFKSRINLDSKNPTKLKVDVMSIEAHSKFRAEVAKRVNKARGIPEATQRKVQRLYLEHGLSAREVAQTLGISKGSVRATINRVYAGLSEIEKLACKRQHGSQARHGVSSLGFSKT